MVNREIGSWVRVVLVMGLLLILGGSVGHSHEVDAQVTPGLWTKYSQNPVFWGDPGSWDEVETFDASVIVDGMTYKMWYTGKDSSRPRRIGYATSSDGISWTKFEGNPVLSEGPTGSWDEGGARWGSVILDDGTYKMWYTGFDGSGVNRIGYATSSDGIVWNKYDGNPVFDVGAPGSWEDRHVLYPTVILDDGTYKMWYTGWKSGEGPQIGYAASNDGIHWTKHPENPILPWGPPGSWDYEDIYAASVLLDNGVYHMWYSGTDGIEYQIGYATSPDGISWTKYPLNPVITKGPDGSFDSGGADWPCVVLEDSTYKMWYSGWGTDEQYRIGYAYAPALTKHIYLPLIMKGY